MFSPETGSVEFFTSSDDHLDPEIGLAMFGRARLIVLILFGLVVAFTYIQNVSNWYFYKYADQYRAAYQFTGAEWHGKEKGKTDGKTHGD